jgi:hypothetical protein
MTLITYVVIGTYMDSWGDVDAWRPRADVLLNCNTAAEAQEFYQDMLDSLNQGGYDAIILEKTFIKL